MTTNHTAWQQALWQITYCHTPVLWWIQVQIKCQLLCKLAIIMFTEVSILFFLCVLCIALLYPEWARLQLKSISFPPTPLFMHQLENIGKARRGGSVQFKLCLVNISLLELTAATIRICFLHSTHIVLFIWFKWEKERMNALRWQ